MAALWVLVMGQRLLCLLLALCVGHAATVIVNRSGSTGLLERLALAHPHAIGPHVYADPDLQQFARESDRKVLVPVGAAAHMGEMALERISPQSRKQESAAFGETRLYFGISGRCSILTEGGRDRGEIARGVSVLVPPGVRHELSGSGAAAASASGAAEEPPCVLLSVTLSSGPWSEANSTGPSKGQLRVTDTEQLPWEKTAHESDLLSKRVHFRKGLVPGLMQLSVARFAPGAVCELHKHATGTEVYVNYAGQGCHLRVVTDGEANKEADAHDLTGGKIDVINPGSLHEAWNDAGEPCMNINIMLADPTE